MSTFYVLWMCPSICGCRGCWRWRTFDRVGGEEGQVLGLERVVVGEFNVARLRLGLARQRRVVHLPKRRRPLKRLGLTGEKIQTKNPIHPVIQLQLDEKVEHRNQTKELLETFLSVFGPSSIATFLDFLRPTTSPV